MVTGYGDFNPGTDFGRAILIIAKIWEGALLGLLVVITERALNLTFKESTALSKLVKREKAAKVIQSFFLYSR